MPIPKPITFKRTATGIVKSMFGQQAKGGLSKPEFSK